MTAPVSPLRSVLDALEQGAPTVAAVRARTGLDATVVDAVMDHLVRTGRVGTSRFVLGCPGSCGACPAAGAAGDCGGGTPRPEPNTPTAAGPHRADLGSGRTLLALWVRRR